MKPQIVNIINFQRGCEPRNPKLDLIKPLHEQLRLIVGKKLPATFLLQYDALIRPDFCRELRLAIDEFPDIEIGCWLEIVQPLVEKAGLVWPGRPGFAWDWHAQAGTPMGYKPEERYKIIDVYMADFKAIWGYYPRSAGAWAMDIASLTYMQERYGLEAACICKDQWGTDGYTLWGGYFNQAYYPSRQNMFCPAQNENNQVPVPIFRMLGSDPIYQYDPDLLRQDRQKPQDWMDVVTLEPVYPGYGGRTDWVDWFFRENYNGLCLSFGYAQVGQENSFGWEGMAAGLTYQIGKIAAGRAEGRLTAETLCDSGRRYRKNYKTTAASVVAALSDWNGQGRQAVWYSSRYYRMGLLRQNQHVFIRDLYRFDEQYPERYRETTVGGDTYTYDNLPLIDGSRWQPSPDAADPRLTGLSVWQQDTAGGGSWQGLEISDLQAQESDGQTLQITLFAKGVAAFQIMLYPEHITWTNLTQTSWQLRIRLNQAAKTDFCKIAGAGDAPCLFYRHNQYAYSLPVDGAAAGQEDDLILLDPQGRTVTLDLSAGRGE